MTVFTEPGLGGAGGGGSGELKKPHPSVVGLQPIAAVWNVGQAVTDQTVGRETPHPKHRQIIFNRKTTA